MPNNNEMIDYFYEVLGAKDEGVSKEKFIEGLSTNPEARKHLYDMVGAKDRGVSIEQFEKKLGIPIKKKDVTVSAGAQDGLPSRSQSNLEANKANIEDVSTPQADKQQAPQSIAQTEPISETIAEVEGVGLEAGVDGVKEPKLDKSRDFNQLTKGFDTKKYYKDYMKSRYGEDYEFPEVDREADDKELMEALSGTGTLIAPVAEVGASSVVGSLSSPSGYSELMREYRSYVRAADKAKNRAEGIGSPYGQIEEAVSGVKESYEREYELNISKARELEGVVSRATEWANDRARYFSEDVANEDILNFVMPADVGVDNPYKTAYKKGDADAIKKAFDENRDKAIPNASAIRDWSRAVSESAGGGSEYAELLESVMTSVVSDIIVRPDVERVFSEKLMASFGVDNVDDIITNTDLYKGYIQSVSQLKAFQDELQRKSEEIEADLLPEAKAESEMNARNTIGILYERIDNDESFIQAIKDYLQPEYDRLQNEVDAGTKTAEDANIELEEIQNSQETRQRVEEIRLEMFGVEIAQAEQDWLDLENERISRFKQQHFNQLNAYRQAKGAKEQELIQSIKDAESKFGQEQADIAQSIHDLYQEAYDEVLGDNENLQLLRDRRDLWSKTKASGRVFLSIYGSMMDSLGRAIGWDAMSDWGADIMNRNVFAQDDIESFKDWGDYGKLSKSIMQLTATSAFMILPSVAAGLATRNYAVAQMVSSILVGWGIDSASTSQGAYDAAYRTTGDVVKAEQARRDAWGVQLKLAPFYAVSMPFNLGRIGRYIGNPIVGRPVANGITKWGIGAGLGVADNLYVMGVQGQYLEAAELYGTLENFSVDYGYDKWRQTFHDVVPGTVFGLSHLAGSVRATSRDMFNYNAAKKLVNDVNIGVAMKGEAFEHGIFDIVQKNGAGVASSLLAMQYRNGELSKIEYNRGLNAVNLSARNIEEAKKLDLDPSEYKFYNAIKNDLDESIAVENSVGDDNPLKAVYSTLRKMHEKELQNYLSTKESDRVLVTNGDEQYVLSINDMARLLRDNDFATSVASGDIIISGDIDANTQAAWLDILKSKANSEFLNVYSDEWLQSNTTQEQLRDVAKKVRDGINLTWFEEQIYNNSKEAIDQYNIQVDAIDKLVGKYGVKNPEKSFEQADISTLSYVIGESVEMKGEKGVIRQDEGGKITFETDDKIVELGNDGDVSLSELGIKYEVESSELSELSIINEDVLTIDGEPYTIGTNENGEIVSLTSESGGVINDEVTLIRADIERSRTLDNPTVHKSVKEVVTEEDASSIQSEMEEAISGDSLKEKAFKEIDEAMSKNAYAGIDDVLDKIFKGESLTEREYTMAEKYLEDTYNELTSLYENNKEYGEFIEQAIEYVYDNYNLLKRSKNNQDGKEQVSVEGTVSDTQRQSERAVSTEAEQTVTEAETRAVEATKTESEPTTPKVEESGLKEQEATELAETVPDSEYSDFVDADRSQKESPEGELIAPTEQDNDFRTPEQQAEATGLLTDRDEQGNIVGSEDYVKNSQDGNHIVGREITITTPTGEKLRGKFKVVPASDLLPSHNPKTFSPNKGFPKTKDGKSINDNDYGNSQGAKANVEAMGNNYTGRAIDDFPVVDDVGVVRSGTNRTMSRQLSAERGTDGDYLSTMSDRLLMYFDSKVDLSNIKDPTLVFELNEKLPYDTKTSEMFNKTDVKKKSPIDIAIAQGKILNADQRMRLAGILDGEENLSKAYSKKSKVDDIKTFMLHNGVIQAPDVPAYFNDNGTLTNSGKELFESLLLGTALKESTIRNLFKEGMGDVRNKLTSSRALAELSKNSALAENEALIGDIDDGIRLLSISKNNGDNVLNYVNQLTLLDDFAFSPAAIFLAMELEGSGFADSLKAYNDTFTSGVEDMFTGKPTKQQRLDLALRDKIKNYDKIREATIKRQQGEETGVSKSDGRIKQESDTPTKPVEPTKEAKPKPTEVKGKRKQLEDDLAKAKANVKALEKEQTRLNKGRERIEKENQLDAFTETASSEELLFGTDTKQAQDVIDKNERDLSEARQEVARLEEQIRELPLEGQSEIGFEAELAALESKTTTSEGKVAQTPSDIETTNTEPKVIQVKQFAKGDGGTKGIFKSEDGKLYKSVVPLARTIKDGKVVFEEIDRETKEHKILSDNQDMKHLPKVGEMVMTSEGLAFEIETLQEVKKGTLTLEEIKQIDETIKELNENRNIAINDRNTVMRRENGEIVLVDFSTASENTFKDRETSTYNVIELLNKRDQGIYNAQKDSESILEQKTLFDIPTQKEEYSYLLTQRPPSIGTHPLGQIKDAEEVKLGNRTAYRITYDKPLSKSEMAKYELSEEIVESDVGRIFQKGSSVYLIDGINTENEIRVIHYFGDNTKKETFTQRGFRNLTKDAQEITQKPTQLEENTNQQTESEVEATAKALEGVKPTFKSFETEKANSIGTNNELEFVKIGNPYIDADIRNGEALTGMPVSETKKIDNILQRLSDLYSDRELEKNDFTVSELTKINEAISFLEGLLTEEQLSEAYHKAKADGSNPELVKAVEKLIGNNDQSSLKPKAETKPQKADIERKRREAKAETKPKAPKKPKQKTFDVAGEKTIEGAKGVLKDALMSLFNLTEEQANTSVELIDSAANGLVKAGIFGSRSEYYKKFPTLTSERGSEISAQQAQDARGAYDRDNNMIRALTEPNISTPHHEVAHWWLANILESAQRGNKQSQRIVTAIDRFLESDKGKEFLRANNLNGSSVYTQRQEAFARGWEQYLATGETNINGLKKLFEDMKNWMKEVYGKLVESGISSIHLNSDLKNVYNAILTGEDFVLAKPDINKLAEDVGESINSDNKTLDDLSDLMSGFDSGTLFQIIGEQGAENLPKVRANLDIARQMGIDGKSPKEIFLATGWEKDKGDKGKWKYDLLDGKIKLKPAELKTENRLEDLYENDDLFKAYPSLKDAIVTLLPLNGGALGSYRYDIHPETLEMTDFIGVDDKATSSDSRFIATLVHEIQHAIQRREGFAKGGGINTINAKEFKANRRKALKDLLAQWEAKLPKYNERWIDEIHNPISERIEEIENRIKDLSNINLDYEAYRRLAGEVEARNVEERLNLSPLERAEKLISETEDVRQEDKIYIYGSEFGMQMALDYQKGHTAPQKEGKNSLDDMSDIYPADLYSPRGLHYYADGHGKADQESYDVIVKAKGKPNMEVTVYRAVPKYVDKINNNDWVTLSKEYAKGHGEHSLNNDYHILETKVKAKDLFNEGSINEFGVAIQEDNTLFQEIDPLEQMAEDYNRDKSIIEKDNSLFQDAKEEARQRAIDMLSGLRDSVKNQGGSYNEFKERIRKQISADKIPDKVLKDVWSGVYDAERTVEDLNKATLRELKDRYGGYAGRALAFAKQSGMQDVFDKLKAKVGEKTTQPAKLVREAGQMLANMVLESGDIEANTRDLTHMLLSDSELTSDMHRMQTIADVAKMVNDKRSKNMLPAYIVALRMIEKHALENNNIELATHIEVFLNGIGERWGRGINAYSELTYSSHLASILKKVREATNEERLDVKDPETGKTYRELLGEVKDALKLKNEELNELINENEELKSIIDAAVETARELRETAQRATDAATESARLRKEALDKLDKAQKELEKEKSKGSDTKFVKRVFRGIKAPSKSDTKAYNEYQRNRNEAEKKADDLISLFDSDDTLTQGYSNAKVDAFHDMMLSISKAGAKTKKEMIGEFANIMQDKGMEASRAKSVFTDLWDKLKDSDRDSLLNAVDKNRDNLFIQAIKDAAERSIKKKDQKTDEVSYILRELARMAGTIAPEQVRADIAKRGAKSNVIDQLSIAIKNATFTVEEWQKAKDNVESIIDNSNELTDSQKAQMKANLNDLIDGYLEKPFSDETLERSINKIFKEDIGLTMREIIKNELSKDNIGADIAKRLVEELGLSGSVADRVAEMARKKFVDMVKKSAERGLASRNYSGGELNKLMQAIKDGKFNENSLRSVFAERFGLTTFTDEQWAHIHKLGEKLNEVAGTEAAIKIKKEIMDYISTFDPRTARMIVNLLDANMYSSALSGLSTMGANIPVGSIMSYTQVTAPLRVADAIRDFVRSVRGASHSVGTEFKKAFRSVGFDNRDFVKERNEYERERETAFREFERFLKELPADLKELPSKVKEGIKDVSEGLGRVAKDPKGSIKKAPRKLSERAFTDKEINDFMATLRSGVSMMESFSLINNENYIPNGNVLEHIFKELHVKFPDKFPKIDFSIDGAKGVGKGAFDAYLKLQSVATLASRYAMAFDHLYAPKFMDEYLWRQYWREEYARLVGDKAPSSELIDDVITSVKNKMKYDQESLHAYNEQLDEIEETNRLAGVKLPKGWRERELQLMMFRDRNQEDMQNAYEMGKSTMLMGAPQGLVGELYRRIIGKSDTPSATERMLSSDSKTLNAVGVGLHLMGLPLKFFLRIGMKSAELMVNNAPIIGLPSVFVNIDSKGKVNTWADKDMRQLFIARAMGQASSTALTLFLFGSMFKREEDDDGNSYWALRPDRVIDITFDRGALGGSQKDYSTNQLVEKYRPMWIRVKIGDRWQNLIPYKYLVGMNIPLAILGGMRDRAYYSKKVDLSRTQGLGVTEQGEDSRTRSRKEQSEFEGHAFTDKPAIDMLSDILMLSSNLTFMGNLRSIQQILDVSGGNTSQGERLMKTWGSPISYLLPGSSNFSRDVTHGAQLLLSKAGVGDATKKRHTSLQRMFYGNNMFMDILGKRDFLDRWGNPQLVNSPMPAFSKNQANNQNKIEYKIINKHDDIYVPPAIGKTTASPLVKDAKDKGGEKLMFEVQDYVAKKWGEQMQVQYDRVVKAKGKNIINDKRTMQALLVASREIASNYIAKNGKDLSSWTWWDSMAMPSTPSVSSGRKGREGRETRQKRESRGGRGTALKEAYPLFKQDNPELYNKIFGKKKK